MLLRMPEKSKAFTKERRNDKLQMKGEKLKKLVLLAIVAMVLLMASPLYAIDSTKHIRIYADQGYSAGYLVNEGLKAVFDADGNQMISTTTRFQLQRKTMTIPVTMASAGEDTVWTQLFTVPTGQTITVEEIRLAAHTEVSGNNDSSWSSILYYTGSATSALDTAVAQFPTDADSAAYADTTLALTLVDSIFTAGDIVTFWQMNLEGAGTGGEGAAISIKYRMDE